jgi:hypothetical protein
MAVVNQKIPNFLGGVSQQPDSLKLPGQVRECINVVPDPTYGLMKRPGLKLISSLSGAVTNGRWFSIFRDSNEKYIGQFTTAGDLKIWNANTGQAVTVNSISAAAKAYIANVSESDFEILQVSDYNFVLNRSKSVAKLTTKSPSLDPKAWINVNQVGYGVEYSLVIDGTTYTHTTAASGTISISSIIQGLITAIGATTYTTNAVGNGFSIQRNDNADFTIEASGGLSGTALVALKESVNSVADLPVTCEDGFIFKVANLDAATADDYYVRFVVQGSGVQGSGIWEETVAPDIEIFIDPDTMPHVIIRESDGTFTFRSLNQAAAPTGTDLYWKEKLVGDDESNPFPTFVGKKITGISFFRNRLILLSGDTVTASQPGSFFNFFGVSAITTTDSDAIDIACGSLQPVDLRYAIPTANGLLLFSEFAQFLLTSEADVFAPSTANINLLSNFNTDPSIKPVETGTSIVFADNNQGYCAVTEMLVTSVDNRPQISDISRTTPNFIKAPVLSLLASPSASLLSFMATGDSKRLALFKFFNNGSSRVMASWFNWDLPGYGRHQAADHDRIYIVTEQENGFILSSCTVLSDVEGTAINQSGIAYEYRLDLFTSSPTTTYDAANDVTKVYFKPGTYDSTLDPIVVVDVSSTDKGQVFLPTASSDGTGFYVPVPGDVTAADITLGYAFEMRVTLPRFYVKQGLSDGSVRADTVNIPRVQRLILENSNSGPFFVTVQAFGRPDITYEFPQALANTYDANTTPLPEIIKNTIPVMAKGVDASVSLYSETPFPISFVSLTWQGIYHNRKIRDI